MLVANTSLKGIRIMTSHRILQLNAVSTAACGVALLGARGILPALFGLGSPTPLDVTACGLLAYAGMLAIAARHRPVSRQALLAFTVADVLWVVASALVLLMFWPTLAPVARLLVIALALVVEVFATLQFRTAGTARRSEPQMA
jgi:hypothetical protein